MRDNRKLVCLVSLVSVLCLLFCGCGKNNSDASSSSVTSAVTSSATVSEDPSGFDGQPYREENGNIPEFGKNDLTLKSFESYSELDDLGRCGVAFACVGRDIMPTEERGNIGQVKPSGWHLVKYDIVDGKYLYNRCHLIGYQLTGENANVKNLITGTRYLNVTGMLPFENEVADYVKQTGNHVMYRVTPVFVGNELVARGVKMEGYSVEDSGKGVCFNVFCYNAQPGVSIDYVTGESHLSGEKPTESKTDGKSVTYIINKNTRKFHLPDCQSAKDTKPQNRKEFTGNRDELISSGYTPCDRCRP